MKHLICSWMGGQKSLLSKICHAYSTMMKIGIVTLYLRRAKKHIDQVAYPLISADISIFSLDISNFYYIKKTDIDSILINNL